MKHSAEESTIEHNATQTAAAQDLAGLAQSLINLRKEAGLSQAEVAEGAGLNRTTVSLGESDPKSMYLQTAARMARAAGGRLVVERPRHPTPVGSLTHRGVSHIRTRHNQEFRDAQREKALATAWEVENKYDNDSVVPLLAELVPGCTQEQATAAATAVQWLGSEQGFMFLKDVLAKAGYDVVDKKR